MGKKSQPKRHTFFEAILLSVGTFLLAFIWWTAMQARDAADSSLRNAESSLLTDSVVQESLRPTPTPSPQINTENWLVYYAPAGWHLRLPDGWQFISTDNGSNLHIGEPQQFMPGTIAEVASGWAEMSSEAFVRVINYTTGDTAGLRPRYFSSNGKLQAKRQTADSYKATLVADEADGLAGDSIYRYVFERGTQGVYFQLRIAAGTKEADQSETIAVFEKALQTFEFIKLNQ